MSIETDRLLIPDLEKNEPINGSEEHIQLADSRELYSPVSSGESDIQPEIISRIRNELMKDMKEEDDNNDEYQFSDSITADLEEQYITPEIKPINKQNKKKRDFDKQKRVSWGDLEGKDLVQIFKIEGRAKKPNRYRKNQGNPYSINSEDSNDPFYEDDELLCCSCISHWRNILIFVLVLLILVIICGVALFFVNSYD